jgi:pimeloyl-ACP methyl ester carboxylesterase
VFAHCTLLPGGKAVSLCFRAPQGGRCVWVCVPCPSLPRHSSMHVFLLQVTLLAESFGGCLALRLAAAASHLVKAIVLLNPATCYNQSLNGLSSFVSATNLLGLFPQDLYNTAQVGWATGCARGGAAGFSRREAGGSCTIAFLLIFCCTTWTTHHRWVGLWGLQGVLNKDQSYRPCRCL